MTLLHAYAIYMCETYSSIDIVQYTLAMYMYVCINHIDANSYLLFDNYHLIDPVEKL